MISDCKNRYQNTPDYMRIKPVKFFGLHIKRAVRREMYAYHIGKIVPFYQKENKACCKYQYTCQKKCPMYYDHFFAQVNTPFCDLS